MNSPIARMESDSIQSIGMITPAGTIEETIKQFQIYQQLKSQLGTAEDFQAIKSKDGKVKYHPNKSFVRKVQRFFNVSCEILQDEALRNADGEIEAWLVKVRAIHLGTGAFQEGDGSCSFDEKRSKRQPATLHNIRAHAVTRAKNRAILDLVGFGEVTAEEISDASGSFESIETGSSDQNLITEKQRRALFSISRRKGLSDEEIRAIISERTDKKSTRDLGRKEASALISYVKDTPLEKIREFLPQDQMESATIEDILFDELNEAVMNG